MDITKRAEAVYRDGDQLIRPPTLGLQRTGDQTEGITVTNPLEIIMSDWRKPTDNLELPTEENLLHDISSKITDNIMNYALEQSRLFPDQSPHGRHTAAAVVSVALIEVAATISAIMVNNDPIENQNRSLELLVAVLRNSWATTRNNLPKP